MIRNITRIKGNEGGRNFANTLVQNSDWRQSWSRVQAPAMLLKFVKMKKIIIALALLLPAICFSQTKRDASGNFYADTAKGKTETAAKQTKYFYTDKDGKKYPVFISKNGKYFCTRISKNGNKYNYYLKP